MGNSSIKEINPYLYNNKTKLFMLGLDGSGKTTSLYHLAAAAGLGEIETTIPTIAMNIETIKYKKLSLLTMDTPRGEWPKGWWGRHMDFKGDGVIFLVDASGEYYRDAHTMSKQLLAHINNDEDLGNVPVLIVVTKTDKPGADGLAQIASKLNLDPTDPLQNWFMISCNPQSDISPYFEGLNWLAKAIEQQRTK